MLWELGRVGPQPMLYSRCDPCGGAGPWNQEPIEIITKPKGRRPEDFPPIAPCDFDVN